MNSLNFVSSRVSPSSSPAPSRSNSLGSMGITVTSEEQEQQQEASTAGLDEKTPNSATPDDSLPAGAAADEDTPLLSGSVPHDSGLRQSSWHQLPRRIFSAVIGSLRWVLSTLAAPGVYLIACLYDEHGHFAPWLQLKRLFGANHADARKMAATMQEKAALEDRTNSSRGETINIGRGDAMATRPVPSSGSSTSGLSSESESEMDRESSSRHPRAKSLQSSEEISPSRRSIRIKLHNEESLRQRKHRKGQSASSRRGTAGNPQQKDISAHLKSPTSPVGALTKYPKTPAPPRPLIPRRQPSYINVEADAQTPQKTLILDLDETLIHSMSKGGRMSTGHMVEVKLNTTYVGVGGQASIGPQHPILYYVHKRPHCDDFLRRVSVDLASVVRRRQYTREDADAGHQVCKWFNLVVFTASVQEYADPVIDWLESERKFFSARYYRQHCTFRHGAFIKDLSAVEPDLSKVMILDNSPLSYMFHQDNAIPIQGWINDPTDNDLQHLIPLFEGLQYVSDVRALLALRGGEDGQHMVV
ncbi:dullard-like phosphatase domain-containing protein [Diaporthe helianthi]|uniref:Dullard-like phosphatase domain-containing protein n=1 Tax=Diaporthe helianthi TaxID=158607 RepID=A0A2P5HLE7_DIAHE|nr:dullard-like phosphatase domain-containing protein [Diaporthe helianthi]